MNESISDSADTCRLCRARQEISTVELELRLTAASGPGYRTAPITRLLCHPRTEQRVALHLDAQQRKLHVQHHGQLVTSRSLQGMLDSLMSFLDYLRLMLEEARSLERYLCQKASQARG